jgi:Glycosyltransferase family 10 (fucosyltransferase) C-term
MFFCGLHCFLTAILYNFSCVYHYNKKDRLRTCLLILFTCGIVLKPYIMTRLNHHYSVAYEMINLKSFACRNDIVPIVMGARKSQYEQVAPPHSFIHVDDFRSPRDLASYLLQVNASDRMYNEYMAWKSPETGRFVDTRFWCRLCAMAHDDSGHVTWYDDVEKWWHHEDSCTPDRWASSSIG